MSKKGFTLIELLVVIAIIGVLASIVLASLNTTRRKSRDARRITDIKQLQLALELYFDGQGNQYPTSLTPLAPQYIPTVPQDPLGPTSTGNCRPTYCYAYASGQTMYWLAARLEETSNPALQSDKDCNAGAGGGNCPTGFTYPFTLASGGTMDGTLGDIYDVMP